MFILYYEISLTNFIVKLYKLTSTQNIVSQENIDALKPELELKAFPTEIIEVLDSLQGISQIQIYDHNEQLLLRTGINIDP